MDITKTESKDFWITDYKVISNKGCPCPTCNQPTEVRKKVTKDGTYEYFYCTECKTLGGVCE